MGKFYTETTVPDGEYRGRWTAYEVDFKVEDRMVHMHTTIGVRGINVLCTFKIVDNKLVEDSLKTVKR